MTTDPVFDRLRSANRFLPVSLVDADALFDRITIAPPGERLRASWRRHRRRGLVLAVALALVALLASTAFALSGWIGGIIGASEVNTEFAGAERALSLPPGYEWPKLNFPQDSVTSRGAGGTYAVNMAQNAWECYWAQSIRGSDTAGQARARAALDDLMTNHVVIAPKGASENWSPPPTSTPTAVYADDGGYQFKQRAYAEAAAGNAQLLQQSCHANAPAAQPAG
jgi:hypothetical protein